MKNFYLDPTVLYPVGTKVWSCRLGDSTITSADSMKQHAYVVTGEDDCLSFAISGKYHIQDVAPSLFLMNPFLEMNDEEVLVLQNKKVAVWDKNDDSFVEGVLAFEYGGNFFTYDGNSDLERVVENGLDSVRFTRWDYCREESPKKKLTKQEICQKFGIDDFELLEE
jgi:hypothetical protein